MSMDTVDDLHHAEDTIGHLAAALEELIGHLEDARPTSGVLLTGNARTALTAARSYCRPTCQADEGECYDTDGCGCLCHERSAT